MGAVPPRLPPHGRGMELPLWRFSSAMCSIAFPRWGLHAVVLFAFSFLKNISKFLNPGRIHERLQTRLSGLAFHRPLSPHPETPQPLFHRRAPILPTHVLLPHVFAHTPLTRVVRDMRCRRPLHHTSRFPLSSHLDSASRAS